MPKLIPADGVGISEKRAIENCLLEPEGIATPVADAPPLSNLSADMTQSGFNLVRIARAFNRIEHAIKRVGQLADFVVSAWCRQPLVEIGMTYPRSRLGDLADMGEHSPGGKEHDAEAQEYDQQPQKKEAKAEFRQHPKLVTL